MGSGGLLERESKKPIIKFCYRPYGFKTIVDAVKKVQADHFKGFYRRAEEIMTKIEKDV